MLAGSNMYTAPKKTGATIIAYLYTTVDIYKKNKDGRKCKGRHYCL